MSAKQFASAPIDVGGGFSVEFAFTKAGILCEWSPDVPSADEMDKVFGSYRQARDWFVAARLARFLGRAGPVTTYLRDTPGSAS